MIWDVSNVENMEAMFSGCTNFNQPLNKWDTSNAERMGGMFFLAKNYNQNLDNFDKKKIYGM
jgi:surface protein